MFRVYISGPITADTTHEEECNVMRSAEMVEWCVKEGMAVYWPHGTWYVDYAIKLSKREPIGYGYLPQDLEWIKYCNAMFVLPGESRRGVKLEVDFANKIGVPVFRTRGKLIVYKEKLEKAEKKELLREENPEEEECSPDFDLDGLPMEVTPFNAILSEIKSLHDSKSHDYATNEDPLSNIRTAEEYGVPSWVGVQFRLDDKRSRIKNAIRGILSGDGIVMKHESLEDSLIDRCVYSIIALQLYRETLNKEN